MNLLQNPTSDLQVPSQVTPVWCQDPGDSGLSFLGSVGTVWEALFSCP